MKTFARNPKWVNAKYEYRLITGPHTPASIVLLNAYPVRGDELDEKGNIIPIPEFIEVETLNP